MAEVSFGLRLHFKGGDADDHRLEAYDGSVSLHGFAQALQIATNAYINQDVTNYSTALKNAKVFMRPARQGSFITDFTTVITRKPKRPFENGLKRRWGRDSSSGCGPERAVAGWLDLNSERNATRLI